MNGGGGPQGNPKLCVWLVSSERQMTHGSQNTTTLLLFLWGSEQLK